MKIYFRIALAVIALLGATLLWTNGAHAQSPVGLTAQVDADQITTDDTVTLTLTLTTPDGSAPRLNLPALDGFEVVNSQTASRYSIVNGKTSANMLYAFDLRPTRTGDLVIPSLKLNLNGQALATDPLIVHVTQGNGTPTKRSNSGLGALGAGSAFSSIFGNDPFNDPFFADPFGNDIFSNNANLDIQALTDKSSVYVGEPLEYTVRVMSDAMLLGEPEYTQPKFTGFWAHEPVSQRGANGTEITTLLFPTQAGKLTIDPATIRADGGFFSNPLEKQTDALAIDVKPLPQGAPAEFNGAVGTFEINATPDKTATRVGEPITVKIEIRGTGNFDTLPAPKWQNDSAWRAYDGKAKTTSNVQFGKLDGTTTFERTLIPTQAGALTIPATRYAYFDPSDARYHTIETQAIQINVAPGDPTAMQNVAPTNNASAPAAAPAPASNAPALKISETPMLSASAPLFAQPLFWALFLVPLGIVAFDVAFGLRKRYVEQNTASRRASRAYRNAIKKLRRVRNDDKAPLAVARITLTYLEDKLNRSLLGVPHSTLAQILTAQQVSADAAMQAIELLRAGETTEFGKERMVSQANVLTNANEILTRVEEEWAE